MALKVYSFDFDGCLFNYHYLSSKIKDLSESNKELFASLKKGTGDSNIVFIGSNRQSLSDDLINSRQDDRGSCFPMLDLLCKELNAKPDTFLMTDLYNNLPAGHSFEQALKSLLPKSSLYNLDEVNKNKPFQDWIHDESKLTVVYAQMHKIASENPLEPIEFNFYDDREDILDGLKTYFSRYPETIPPNITLKLHRYKGTKNLDNSNIDPLIASYASLYGNNRSKIDSEYRTTVKTMAAVTIEKLTAQGIDITSSQAGYPVRTYDDAEKAGFAISPIKCVEHYQPGDEPLIKPQTPPITPAPRKGSQIGTRLKTSISSLFTKPKSVSSTPEISSQSPDTSPPNSASKSRSEPTTRKNSSSSNENTPALDSSSSRFWRKKNSKEERKDGDDDSFNPSNNNNI